MSDDLLVTEDGIPIEFEGDMAHLGFEAIESLSDQRALRRRIGRGAVAAESRRAKTRVVTAGELFHLTGELARAWTFSSASDEQLEHVLTAMQALYAAADAVDRLEGGNA